MVAVIIKKEDTMTPKQFKKLQTELGYHRNVDFFAALLCKKVTTVYHYRTGILTIPAHVVQRLEDIQTIIRLTQELTAANKIIQEGKA